MLLSHRNLCRAITLTAILAVSSGARADGLAAGVRGVATRAPKNMKIDGDLSEFKNAFCTPVEYFNRDLKNRAAQFFYMWDDEAFYAGLRTLDRKQANHSDDDHLWGGDGVEWYFDTRRGDNFRNQKWEAGAVHCYWTAFSGTRLKSRFCLRPGYLDAIKKLGVQVAGRRTKVGTETEFKLPWVNFPDFKPRAGEVIALDAELCYSDGGPRVFRSFVYGSPLSVQQPASLGKIQLVDTFTRSDWKQCGAVMMPLRVDTPWSQKTKARVVGQIALPPNRADQVGRIVFRVTGLDGKTLGEYAARRSVFAKEGNFVKATADWPIDVAPPGRHHVTAIIYDTKGRELTRIAPRLVSVNMRPGY